MSRAGGDPARLWIPVFALFTLHNLEEIARNLPAWGRAHVSTLAVNGPGLGAFIAAVIALSLALFAVAWMFRNRPRATVRLQVLFLAVMIVNFIWHIAASAYTASLQPGVLTAILVLPVYGYLLAGLLRRAPPAATPP